MARSTATGGSRRSACCATSEGEADVDALATLERQVRTTQAQARVPALSAAVQRHDRPVWTLQVGRSGTETPLQSDTLFRIGSVTKTFTAVTVMQCRDDGLLELD